LKALLGVVLARCPRSSAGHTCAVMNWVIGLRQLGWDVWIVEHIDGEEVGEPEAGAARSPQEEFWHATAAEFGLSNRQCLLVNGKSPELEAMRDFASGADFFLNYSGQFKRLDLIGGRAVKCYLDVDPGFTQLWADVCGSDMNFEGHDLFFTVGTNFGAKDVRLPQSSREWVPLLPTVSLDYWKSRLEAAGGADVHGTWSTVAHWYGYNDLMWDGLTYGGKRENLRAAAMLPRICAEAGFTVASDLEPGWEDHAAFVAGGWKLARSSEVCRDVDSYLRFIGGSAGEIGVAKGGYVVSRGGWISDRSMIYLSMGRPVLLQETGWSRVVEPRDGLWPFDDMNGAAEKIREVRSRPEENSRGAEELARTVFAPSNALKPLLERIG
jgi:hypothetical protein